MLVMALWYYLHNVKSKRDKKNPFSLAAAEKLSQGGIDGGYEREIDQ